MSKDQKQGIIVIWERCVERWKDRHGEEGYSVPAEFIEMKLFIEELKDRL